MGWTNEQATEITAPADVPFAPGFDVMGIGSELPPELENTVIRTAMVMYNSNWDPTSTVKQVKFHFLGTAEFSNGTAFVIGMGSCQNAHLSQLADVGLNFVLMMPSDDPTTDTFFLMQNSQSELAWGLTMATTGKTFEDGTNTNTGAVEWSLPGNAGV